MLDNLTWYNLARKLIHEGVMTPEDAVAFVRRLRKYERDVDKKERK